MKQTVLSIAFFILVFYPHYTARYRLGSFLLFWIWVVCLIGGTEAKAQSSSTANLLPPKFIPKSPTLSAFPRFDTQQLVNLPTGAAQLAVPLAEVSCGSLQLPVSLAYSYSGLKVGQPYDLVGLGWALQAGVSITRQVNGLVDDNYLADPLRRYDPAQLRTGVNQAAFLKRVAEQDVDTGPDVYSFSLPGGLSGRFIILDTTIVLLPQQPVHIRRLPGATYGMGFQIATEDGVRYQFQAVEVTSPHPDNFGSNAQHASAWHLTRLISASNADTLHLYYTPHTERLPRQCTITTGRYYTGTYFETGNISTGDGDNRCGSTADYTFYNVPISPSQLQTQYLDSITARGTCLTFTYGDAFRGMYIPPGFELRRVRLLSTIGERREIKRLTLYQSPFTPATPSPFVDYRLRLDSLQESANNLRLPAYRFRYAEGYFPSRSSAALDYWGYANGATSNGDVNSTTNPTLLADPLLNQGQRRAANREPNFEAAVAGALQQVRYPTGGTTDWSYEPGRLLSADEDIPFDYLSADVSAGYEAATAQPLNGKLITSSRPVVFQVPQSATVTLLLHRDPYSMNRTGGTNTYNDFSLWRRLTTGDSLITTIQGSAYRIYDGDPTEKNYAFPLAPGTYVAQVFCEAYEAYTSLDVRIPYRDSAQVRLGLLGPGIRVARTTTTAAGAPPLIHTYQYSLGNRSSGLSLLPQLGKGFDSYTNSNASSTGGNGATSGVVCEYMNTSSDNRALGSEFNKYDFYYFCVTETTGPGQGITRHTYTHRPQQFNEVVPVSEVTYRQSSLQPTAQQLVQQTYYTYAADSDAVYPLLRVRVALSHNGDANGGADTYTPTPYELRAAFFKPLLTAQLRYDDQGQIFTTTTRSAYQRQRLVRTTTRTSTGWDIQRIKRLSDYTASPTVSALRVNSFNPVIETQSWHRSLPGTDSLLIGGQLTFYDPISRNPASLYQLRLDRPQVSLNQEGQLNGKYTSLLSDTRYERQATVRYATGSGDLLQHQPTHGQPTSFLMGYKRTLVMAEAKNATYPQIAYTSFEAEATGRWQYDSTGTHRMLGGRTGRWAYQLDGTVGVSRDQLPAGEYELIYWVQGSTSLPFVNVTGGSQVGGSAQFVASAPDHWQQYRVRLRFTSVGRVSLNGGSGRLDEVRLYPVGAQLTSYTHEPLVGMTSQTGPDGRTQTYEYDGLGRLIRTRDEQGRILGQQQYHYAGQ